MEADDEIESIEISLLLEAINARYGYDLRGYAPTSMQRLVRAALAKSTLDNFGELQHRILRDPVFFASVLEDLTVRVSDMFRDPALYRAVRARIIPILRTYPMLKIWHSGCATGEEVYTSAILLSEEGLYDRSQIYATDLSQQAIEQARQGVYSMEQVATFAANHEKSGGLLPFTNFYTAAYDRIAIKESIRRNIVFFQHNLVSDQVFGEMHVIFCRNVLLYFGQELRDRVLTKLAESLCPAGFLCLGSSERLLQPQKHGFVEYASAERIYRLQAPYP